MSVVMGALLLRMMESTCLVKEGLFTGEQLLLGQRQRLLALVADDRRMLGARAAPKTVGSKHAPKVEFE